jgi:hypothetical protein
LQNIFNAGNREIFQSNIVLLLDYKWKESQFYVYMHGMTYIVYALLIMVDFYWPNYYDKRPKYVVGAYSVLFFMKEMLQMRLDGIVEYFSDPFNWCDLIG